MEDYKFLKMLLTIMHLFTLGNRISYFTGVLSQSPHKIEFDLYFELVSV